MVEVAQALLVTALQVVEGSALVPRLGVAGMQRDEALQDPLGRGEVLGDDRPCRALELGRGAGVGVRHPEPPDLVLGGFGPRRGRYVGEPAEQGVEVAVEAVRRTAAR